MPVKVGDGILSGIEYIVILEDDGTKRIAVGPGGAALANEGANMKLLDDIGDQNPDTVMTALIDSVPQIRPDPENLGE